MNGSGRTFLEDAINLPLTEIHTEAIEFLRSAYRKRYVQAEFGTFDAMFAEVLEGNELGRAVGYLLNRRLTQRAMTVRAPYLTHATRLVMRNIHGAKGWFGRAFPDHGVGQEVAIADEVLMDLERHDGELVDHRGCPTYLANKFKAIYHLEDAALKLFKDEISIVLQPFDDTAAARRLRARSEERIRREAELSLTKG